MVRKRRKFSSEFKAKVALESVRGAKTLTELSQEYKVHPNAISNWRKQLLENLPEIFDSKRGPKPRETEELTDRLYQQIGKLQVELEWLKKNLTISVKKNRKIIDPANKLLTIGMQCSLINLSRSTYYYSPVGITAEEIEIMKAIDRIYTKHPFYGVGKITECLRRAGNNYNHKRISRLMRIMGIQALRPKKKLSKRNINDVVYPYLLRGVSITENNQVWSTDITYLPLYQGFAYLVAVIDWYSRYILSWEISNSLDVYFCLEALEKSLKTGKPKIFNTDQGSQFTSNAFTQMVIKNDIKLSMDGRGRALDNIFIERFWRSLKYEDVYLKDYQSISELRTGLTDYFDFYNNERFHQSLNYKTPAEVYFN